MIRNELLEALKPHLRLKDYIALAAWTKKREKSWLFFDTKFSCEVTLYGKGFVVSTGRYLDYIIVY